ncbi:MAG: DUF72 domain-containing protein [Proteobacteria bacterium]|nr:MAG: DUF72 domain-containing protein [Pseudomonadota bacterium]
MRMRPAFTRFPVTTTRRRQVETIELNGSFYSLVLPQSVRRWMAETPDDFLFSVKGSRFITHMKRLKEVEVPLANFFASGLLALGPKFGPLLWQLPPSFAFDEARLEAFFRMLPRTQRAAASLASKHDARLEGRAVVEASHRGKLRHTLEVRHPSFDDPRFHALLKKHDVALCIADTAGVFPELQGVTADFVYVRLHGDTKLYESGYSRAALTRWAKRVRAWSDAGQDVFVYFDNDAKVRAPFDARTLRALLDGRTVPRLPKGIADAGEPARETWPAWQPRP